MPLEFLQTPTRHTGAAACGLAFLLLSACSGLSGTKNTPAQKPAVEMAFVGVNVLPMDREVVLVDQTVVVHGNRVVAIGGADEVPVPGGAIVIEGHGRYLMPGLVDMHVHICDVDDLALLLASGVTTVRNMGEYPGFARLFGFPNVMALKERVARGQAIGPTIYTTGPVLDGRKPVSPFFTVMKDAREAERAVREQHSRGYELIKVYDKLPPDVYERILEVAGELGLQVVGHVPKAVGIDTALARGQHSIEHLTGYIDNDKSGFVIPEALIAEYAARTAASGVWNCPTLTVYDNLVAPSQFSRILSRSEARFVPGRMKFLWKKTLQAAYKAEYSGPDYAAHMREVSRRMTRALHEAGARLVAGTDMNFVGVFPGVSLHRELKDLVETGLSPYEALACTTVNAAECLDRRAEFGTIEIGKRADLILLEANPLENIEAVAGQVGVMARGRWYPRETLERMLAKR